MARLNWDKTRHDGKTTEPMSFYASAETEREMIDFLLAKVSPISKFYSFVMDMDSALARRGRLTDRQSLALRKAFIRNSSRLS